MSLDNLAVMARMGELLALRWCDVDFSQRQITVRQAVAYGELGPPKSDEPRSIPMGDELWTALKAHRHIRGRWCFPARMGQP